MRPLKLKFIPSNNSYSVVGEFDKLLNFAEFSSAAPGIMNNSKSPTFQISEEVWLQFVPHNWNNMVNNVVEEMVECWNEKYSNNKHSPMREEIIDFKQSVWDIIDFLNDIKQYIPDCPDSVVNKLNELMDNYKKKSQLNWNIKQDKINSLKKENERLRNIIRNSNSA